MYLRTNYGFAKSFSLISVVNQTAIKNLWDFSLTNSLEWRTLNVMTNNVSTKNTYPIYTLYTTQNFTNIANTGIDANINAMYMNKWVQANLIMKSFGNLDFGFSKNFAKPDIRASLAVEDILYTNISRSYTLPNPQIMNFLSAKSNTRLIRFTLIKKFGNKKMKNFESINNNNTEEKSRL